MSELIITSNYTKHKSHLPCPGHKQKNNRATNKVFYAFDEAEQVIYSPCCDNM